MINQIKHPPARMSGILRFVETTSPDVWALAGPIYYSDAEYGTLTAHAGVPTDGASIPRFLWPIVGPPLRDARTARPAVLHDLLYYLSNAVALSRRDADIIFARGLLANDVPLIKVVIYYAGVRLGGWRGWRFHQREIAFQREMSQYLLYEPSQEMDRWRK